MKKFLLSATALTALSFTALAADLPSKKEAAAFAPSPIFTWAGAYLGGTIGLVDHSGKVVANYNDGGYLFNSPVKAESKGVLGGVTSGFNYQASSSLVAGVEADISLSSAKSGQSGVGFGSGWGTGFDSHSLSSLGTVRGRLGFLIDPATLAFATAGFAFGNVKSVACDDGCDYGYTQSKWRLGWTAGGGVEHAFTRNWTGKIEALYYDLGSKSYANLNYPTYIYSEKNSGALARIGVNYKF